MEQYNIAIDGPSSAGKSTIAKKVAARLGTTYLDTGAMYRALTLSALRKGADLESEPAILAVLDESEIHLTQVEGHQTVFLNDEDVTETIRSTDVTKNVSVVSSHEKVRAEMVRRQQRFAEKGGIVMDGRDIGTVVLPNADLKIYLVASAEERALRRYHESVAKGMTVSLEQLTEDMKARDHYDMNREASPLRKADDAVELDTTHLSIDAVVETVLNLIKK
ncbi:(d)CMP kinase [Jeotgalibaca porci]|uniref:Cytidylate kinase n=6 Tax=Jeotgalibaca porci TaxID=1868793 RepID=A0A6G7WJY3_9LACT|nr:(d)CMP kinase [Jeotgalibaca porci]NLB98001.1 (d)CMP kinase [Lactobacillales bacterium]QIK52549.1 (d)CMP kinase [Jeotgalibaca porci]